MVCAGFCHSQAHNYNISFKNQAKNVSLACDAPPDKSKQYMLHMKMTASALATSGYQP